MYIGCLSAYCFRFEKFLSLSRRQTSYTHRPCYLMTISPSLAWVVTNSFGYGGVFRPGRSTCSVLYVLILQKCVVSRGGAHSIAVIKRLVLFRRSDINIGRQIGRAGTSTSGRRISYDLCIRFTIFCTVLRIGRPRLLLLLRIIIVLVPVVSHISCSLSYVIINRSVLSTCDCSARALNREW